MSQPPLMPHGGCWCCQALLCAVTLVAMTTTTMAVAAATMSNATAADANETALSDAAFARLMQLPKYQRTPARALLLCQEASPALFCGWFSTLKRDGSLHSMACFDETQGVCNRHSHSKYDRKTYGRFTMDCANCAPCGRLADCPDSGGCEAPKCLCSCARRDGQELQLDGGPNQWDTFPCHRLCNGESDCPASGNDEFPPMCEPYVDRVPSKELPWYYQVLIIIAVVVVISIVGTSFDKRVKLRRWSRPTGGRRQATTRASAASAAAASIPLTARDGDNRHGDALPPPSYDEAVGALASSERP